MDRDGWLTEIVSSGVAPRRFVDPEQLICPGCGEQVRPEAPGYWRVADGLPAPGFSHQDATALCRRADGAVAQPIEIPALT